MYETGAAVFLWDCEKKGPEVNFGRFVGERERVSGWLFVLQIVTIRCRCAMR